MKTSQNQQILAHLESGLSLTAFQGLAKFQCFRLAARISDLRRKGHDIKTDMIELNSGKRIAKYYLV
jgi:hypothetical protein